MFSVSFFWGGTKKKVSLGFPWRPLGSGWAESESRASSRGFERPEHATRSPTGTQACAAVYARGPCVPRRQGREQRPAVGTETVSEVLKTSIFYVYIRVAGIGVVDVSFFTFNYIYPVPTCDIICYPDEAESRERQLVLHCLYLVHRR